MEYLNHFIVIVLSAGFARLLWTACGGSDTWRMWREDRKRQQNIMSFAAGYSYAKHFDGPPVDLHNLVETARTFGDYNDFDRGIEAFLGDINWRPE